MADDLKRVGLVFKADGAVDFKKTMQQVNTAVQENKNAFQLAKAAWDDSTTSLEKMADKQKYLQSQTETYSEKVDVLKRELELMEDAEDRNEQAIRKKKTQLTQAEIQLTKYQKGLADVTKEITSGSANSEEEMQKLDKSIKKLDTSARENESAFKLVKSQWDKNTTAAQKLKDEQGYLSNQTETYKGKLENLKEQLKLMETAEERDEQAISEKRREINETETALNEYGKSLEEIETKLKTGEAQTEEYAKKLEAVGEKAITAGKTLSKNVSAPIVAVGGLAIKSAMELDEGYDTIITKTGATGDALEELNDVADSVFGSMPVEMSNVGVAVGEINTRFGATGHELEDLSKKFIEFSQINEIDLNSSIGTVDKIMEQFGVDSSETGNLLGILTKRSQETGIATDTLMQTVSSNSATFKELGFSVTDSINILAQFEQNGVDSSTAIAGLRKSITNMAADGLSADETLQSIISSIKNATTETEAINIASEVFGTKGAVQMTDAIRSGRLSLDELQDSLGNYSSVVQETYETTLDPWDKMKAATNDLKLAGSDLAGEIFEVLAPMLDSMAENAKNLTTWFSGLSDGQKQTIVTIGLVAASIGPLLIVFGSMCSGVSKIIGLTTSIIEIAGNVPDILSTIGTGAKFVWAVLSSNPIVLIIGAVVALIAIFVTLYNKCEWFRDGVNNIFGSIKDFLGETKKWLLHIFDFEWKLPEIKLPHFKIDGKFSLNPPSTPKIAVDWYAKGGILNSPTIFGMNGSSMMGGGEAGKEAVLPIDLLKSYIREENQANNFALAAMILEAIKGLDLRAENNIYIGNSKLETILTDMVLKKMSGKMRNAMQWG